MMNLVKLLNDLYLNKTESFNGIGIVVYSDFASLPVIPMNPEPKNLHLPIDNYQKILQALLEVSSVNSAQHDGFHLISSDFKLTHLGQYFSTPIVKDKNIQGSFGSRYLTALYGSFLQGVLMTGVLSKNYGPFIFVNGQVYSKNEFEKIK